MRSFPPVRSVVFPTLLLAACAPPPPEGSAQKGGACAPVGEEGPRCVDGLACDPVDGQDGVYVCGEPVEIHGSVIDLQTGTPIAGALVNALDRTGAPLGTVAVTDSAGLYALVVSAPRDENGELSATAKFTLQAFARDYLPFPSGIRIALPVDGSQATYDDELKVHVIENPLTTVGLVLLPPERRGGVTISGKVGGVRPGGTLVVAEGVGTEGAAQYGVADLEGDYTIFNVQPGTATIVGYHRGLELTPATVTVGGADATGVDLAVVAEGEDALAQVSGSVNIVNAPGGSVTSVVLVPVSVFNTVIERGPVPFGLRAPNPGIEPNVDNSFTIPGVPAGTYKALAAFENEFLVRDPDTSIGGTMLQEVTVTADQDITLDASFKITEALAVVSPGRDEPEPASATPTFIFADDSSEDRYIVRVFDVFGTMIWEDTMIPAVKGGDTVEVPYAGPALVSGLYYQFRAISVKDDTPISATEDLRGVFVVN